MALSMQMHQSHSHLSFLILIWLLIFNLDLGHAKVINLTTRNGLSQNTVQCIYQDHLGYLWFGTQDGLNKYNGYEFEIFRHNPTDSLSLNHNSITSIYEDSNNQLWIGTIRGLNKFDNKTQTFTCYDFYDVSKISELPARFFPVTNKKFLLIATGTGLYLFNKKERATTRLHITVLNSISDSVLIYDYAWQPSKRPTLWLATKNNGLLKATFSGFKIINSKKYQINPDFSVQIRSLAVQQDTLWIGTSKGLFYTLLTTEEPEFVHWLPKDQTFPANAFIRKLFLDDDNRLWIGTVRNGLFVRSKGKAQKINNNGIFSIFMDSFKTLWVGTSGDGIFKYNFDENIFKIYQPYPMARLSTQLNHIWAFFEDSLGIIWLGTNHGLKFFRPDSKTSHQPIRYKQLAKKIGDVQVRVIKQDRFANLWIGTLEKGLFQIRPDGSVKNFSTQSAPGFRLSFNQVYSLCIDKQQNLWIGTNGGGISQAVIKNGQVQRIVNNRYPNIATNKELWVLYIIETSIDSVRFLWFATWEYGLIGINLKTQKLIKFNTKNSKGLFSDYILTLHYSENSGKPILWIGTYGGGLARLDLQNNIIQSYLEKDGLANNVIYAILEDQRHNLWLSTNNGISVFNPQSELFTNYTVNDGLPSNEFNLNAALKSVDGRLFFGGVKGVCYAQPGMAINHIPPKINISKITIYSKNRKKILFGPFSKPIRLNHNENALVINFVGLHSKNSDKIEYAYQMSGWGEKWIQSGRQRQVTFLNLEPGNYSFKVKACNCDGIWSQKPESVTLIIAPPFWKTSWAIISYLLFIGLFLYFLHRRKLAQEIKIAKIKEQERLKTKEEIDGDLHNEIGGSVVNIIQTCHDILYRKDYSKARLIEAIQKILICANNLEADLREYFWEIKTEKSTLEDLITKIRAIAGLILDEEKYDFQFINHITNLNKIEVPIEIRRAVINIFKEGMTNILKHSNNCEQIIFEFKQTNDSFLEISLFDDGPGIDFSRNFNGKGLESMKERAQKVNGELNILSEAGKGTTLIFRVKLS